MTDRAALAQKLTRALLDLGDTEALVVTTLAAQGCRLPARCRNRAEVCPVAQYLRRQLGPEWVVSVSWQDVLAWRTGEAYDPAFVDRVLCVPLPLPVQAVVWNLDHHGYPALEARPS